MKILKHSLRLVCHFLLGLMLGGFVPGYLCGVIGYGSSYGGIQEQLWLDDCIDYMKLMRVNCDDPDLQDVIDYTIQRYNQIGPFDVSVTHLLQVPFSEGKAIGHNNPLIPGISVDINLLRYSIRYGAEVLIHEAMHDYYPFLGTVILHPAKKS